MSKMTTMNQYTKDELYLFPAYGRKYSGFDTVVQDWQDGKDFSINGFGGPYCSIRDLEALEVSYHKVFLVNSTGDCTRIM